MKSVLLMLPVLALLAACDTMEQRQITGTVGGAALGAAVSGSNDKVTGALAGGLLGMGAATLMGPNPGNCVYQRRNGSQYEAPCQ